MGFEDILKSIAEIYVEANKAENNAIQKKFLRRLSKIEKNIRIQKKRDKTYLIIGVVISSVFSAILGYLLGIFF